MFSKLAGRLALVLGLAGCAARAFDNPVDPNNPATDVELLGTYPARAQQAGGLDFVDEELWVVDQLGSRLHRLRASNGDSLYVRTLSFSMFGVADDGTFVWLTQPGGAQLIRVDPSGASVQVLPTSGGTPRGVAYDDENRLLWVISTERVISRIDPNTGPVGEPILVPTIEQPGGLTFRGSELWAVDQRDSRLVHLGLDGAELASYTLPFGNAVGLTSDGDKFYYSDTASRIHIIALRDEE